MRPASASMRAARDWHDPKLPGRRRRRRCSGRIRAARFEETPTNERLRTSGKIRASLRCKKPLRADPASTIAGRLRRGIRIECGIVHGASAGPKSHADRLVRVRLARDPVGSGALRRAPAGKSRDRQIETSPKKMHGTIFSDKSRSKFLEHRIHVHKNPPKAMSVLGGVRFMRAILVESNRIGNLHGHRPDLHFDIERAQRGHKFGIKIGDTCAAPAE